MKATQANILVFLKKMKLKYAHEGIISFGLFGSYATNKETTDSDIDILFELDPDYLKTHDAWDYFNLLNDCKSIISNHFSTKVDIFDKNSTSSIKEHILKELIYV